MKKKRYHDFKLFILTFSVIFIMFITGCTGTSPIINFFLAEPNTINEGDISILSWNVTGADTVSIAPGIGTVALIGTTTVSPITSTTYTLTATNTAGSVIEMVMITVNPIPTLTISQTEGTAKAVFGYSPSYINVGQGQSFEVTEPGFFDEFQIYLTSDQPTDNSDIIICDLRNNNGNILQSVSINGFAAGNGGWQIFNFNQGTYITPGTYFCTCYVNNPAVDHWYNCHGNTDSASYPNGDRWFSTGGNPGDWGTWSAYPSNNWDLLFKVKIILPII